MTCLFQHLFIFFFYSIKVLQYYTVQVDYTIPYLIVD